MVLKGQFSWWLLKHFKRDLGGPRVSWTGFSGFRGGVWASEMVLIGHRSGVAAN